MAYRGYDTSKGTHWATAQCGEHTINIYQYPGLGRIEGYTLGEAHTVPYVLLNPKVFKKVEVLDEVLMHEFVHVCEFLWAHILRRPSPVDCSQYAIVMGKYLSQMLRTLKQVGEKKKGKKTKKKA